MMDKFNDVINVVTKSGLKVVIALVVLYIAFKVINSFMSKLEKQMLATGKLDVTITKTLMHVAQIALKILVALGLVNYVGFDTSSITALIASFGVCLGLAVNGAVSNFAGGILLLITRPFKVGDFIEVAGQTGTVTEINLIYTVITTLDNKHVHVANSAASSATVVNYSEEATRRVDQVFSIAYNADYDKARGILMRLAEENKAVLADPAPFVRMSSHSASSIDITTRLWVNAADYWDVYFYMLEEAKKEFDAAGIEIPFNQIDVHMR